MVRSYLVTVLLCSGLSAQIVLPMTMSYQGSDSFSFIFNKKQRTLGLLKTITCNPTGSIVYVPSPLVDQQIEAKGMPVMARAVVVRSITAQERRDWKVKTVIGLKYAAFATTLLLANSKGSYNTLRIAAPAASVAFQQLTELVKNDIPPSGVEALAQDLLAPQFTLEPGGCKELLRVVRWSNKYPEVQSGQVMVPDLKK